MVSSRVSGEDNYFSPELSDDIAGAFWQRIDKPTLILHSAEDEFVSKSVDKDALVKHWTTLCRPGIASRLSGTIPGGGHRVEESDAEKWLAETVVRFLQIIK